MKKNYYDVLGVAKTADADQIKAAYRKKAKEFHPDRNPGDKSAEDKFKDVSEAYAVLSDDAKRKKYDSFGAENFAQAHSTDDILRDFNIDDILSQFGMRGSGWGNFGGRGRARVNVNTSTGGGGSSIFDDLFSGFGGGGGAPKRPQAPAKGAEAQVAITVSFHEAMFGGERPLHLNVGGEDRKFTLRIPPGIASGKRLRVKGEGHRGTGGTGDLSLLVTVAPDPRFERQGDDLHTVAPVKPSTLLLGGAVEVETLHGRKSLTVAAGTTTDQLIRIRKQGAPVLGKSGQHGDLFVRLVVLAAGELTTAQRTAAEALRDAGL